jgi:hypothetical protein
MKNLLIIPCFVFGACAQVPTADLAIRGVTIVDVSDGSLSPGQTVLVEGDRIVAVGPVAEVAVPDDAEVVDAPDGYLIPGLWDMHAHTLSIPIARDILFPLFIANGVTGIRTMKTDCFEAESTPSPGDRRLDWIEQPYCFEEGLADPIPSIYDVKTWREEIQAGTLIGPRIVAGSAMLDGPGTDEQSTPFIPGTAEHAREHARILQERGVDFAKIYNFIPREAYFAFADEANRLGLPFAGHVPEGVRASEASEAGQRSIEHAGFTNVADECSAREDEIRRRLRAELESDEPQIVPIWLDVVESYDAVKCAKVFETLVRNGTWVTPTLLASGIADSQEIRDGWREDPRLRYLSREAREWWSNEDEPDAMGGNPEQQQLLVNFGREVTLAMHRAGVPLLAGSPAPGKVTAGFGLHGELEVLVAIGLTEAEALRTATLEPARYLDAVDTQGTVEVGKVADLVLLSANPLEDIANTQKIEAVMVRGRFFDRNALDEILENVARAAAELETGNG